MRPRRVGAAAIVVSAIVALGWPGSTAAQIVEFPLPTTAALPDGIAAGPDGALWFTEFNGNKIGRITTAGVVTEVVIPFPATLTPTPQDIAAGPDGNLWFTEYNGNRIGRVTVQGTVTSFTVPTKPASLHGIAAGPDGNVWFAESSGNKIGRITP